MAVSPEEHRRLIQQHQEEVAKSLRELVERTQRIAVNKGELEFTVDIPNSALEGIAIVKAEYEQAGWAVKDGSDHDGTYMRFSPKR